MNAIRIFKLLRISLVYGAFQLVVVLAGYRTGYTAPTYEGREDGAEWRHKAFDRIERIRKADLAVEIVDGKGRPLNGAQVSVVMQRHAFGFGTAVTARDLTDNSAIGRRYREIVERTFNKAVFENDMKWGQWETALRKRPDEFYNIDNTFSALRWLRDRGIAVRGHYVAWGPIAADNGTVSHAAQDGSKFRNTLLRHAEDKVLQVGDLVSEWDVVNHPIRWGKKPTILDICGADFYRTVFIKVQEWNPKSVRFINEDKILTASGTNFKDKEYYDLIRQLLDKNVPLQGIGFMGHFFAEKDLRPPQKLFEILDRYSIFKLPLQVTEFDIRFGSAGEFVNLSPEQEKLQADYTQDFLIATFSHPSVVGVVMWGFWEGRHWYPSAALYRKDWTIKPNGRVWEDLVLRQWWTKANGVTDAKGHFATRAFLGDYTIEATHKGKRGAVKNYKLDRSGGNVRVVIQ